MVSIPAGSGLDLRLVGHGIVFDVEYPIADGVVVSPMAPVTNETWGSFTMGALRTTLNIIALGSLANFSLLISHPRGGEELAARGWNALWVFQLLALACRGPAFPLYSVADEKFTVANRNLIIRPLPEIVRGDETDLSWASANYDNFEKLLSNQRFVHAIRYYGNAHYLFDDDAKIMLLWAGIEGLLGVEAELRRRVALHAAILFDGSPDEKAAYSASIKKGYDVRSKVVHGTLISPGDLRQGYLLASEVLVNLLRKCVELGRVPAASEIDEAAAAISFPI